MPLLLCRNDPVSALAGEMHLHKNALPYFLRELGEAKQINIIHMEMRSSSSTTVTPSSQNT